MDPKNKGIAIMGIGGITAISIGIGAAFGWPFGLMFFGGMGLLLSIAAS